MNNLKQQTLINFLFLLLTLVIFFKTKINIAIHIPNVISYTNMNDKLIYKGALVDINEPNDLNIDLEFLVNNTKLSYRDYQINPLSDSAKWNKDSIYIHNLLTPKHWKYINDKKERYKFSPYAVYVNKSWEKTLDDELHLYCRFVAQSYVRKVYKMAQNEQVYTRKLRGNGIPAAVTIAQGILESNTGLSSLAAKYNNHFGVKCPGYNEGKAFKFTGFNEGDCDECICVNKRDDSTRDLFRANASIDESYRQHTKVLLKDRYKPAFSNAETDYVKWCKAIRKAGYATDDDYAIKLIKIIRVMRLSEFSNI